MKETSFLNVILLYVLACAHQPDFSNNSIVLHICNTMQAKNVDVAFKATHWALSKYGKKGGQKVLLYDIGRCSFLSIISRLFIVFFHSSKDKTPLFVSAVLEQNVLGIPFSGLPVVFAAIVLVLVRYCWYSDIRWF